MQRVVLLERRQRQAWSKQRERVGTHWVLAEAGHDYRPQLLLRLEQLLLLIIAIKLQGNKAMGKAWNRFKLQPIKGRTWSRSGRRKSHK